MFFSAFIEVDSIEEAITKISELSGEIVEPKSNIPNIGLIASCKDTEGNIL